MAAGQSSLRYNQTRRNPRTCWTVAAGQSSLRYNKPATPPAGSLLWLRGNRRSGTITFQRQTKTSTLWLRGNRRSGTITMTPMLAEFELWLRGNRRSGTIRSRATPPVRQALWLRGGVRLGGGITLWLRGNRRSGTIGCGRCRTPIDCGCGGPIVAQVQFSPPNRRPPGRAG